MKKENKLLWILGSLFFLEWLILAFDVQSREDWALENALVLLSIGPVGWLYLQRRLSPSSLLMIFVFLSIHLIGAHYTYSLVPYDRWFQETLGSSPDTLFGFQRNHFDRLVHFLWGFLLFRPLYEVITFTKMVSERHASWFVVSIVMTTSTLYELIEWLAALVFGGDLGVAYVGAQGDVWDAQKDQALALSGALLALLLLSFRAKQTRSSNSTISPRAQD